MRDTDREQIRAGWRYGARIRTKAGAAAAVLTGCGAVLALAIGPAGAQASSAAGPPAAGTITTLAGGVGAPAAKAELGGGCGATVDGAGNLVFPDGGRVRVVARKTGTFYGQHMIAGNIYTVAIRGTEHCCPGLRPDLGHHRPRQRDRQRFLQRPDQGDPGLTWLQTATSKCCVA